MIQRNDEPSEERVQQVTDLSQWVQEQVWQEAKRRGLTPADAGCALSWGAAQMACRAWLRPGGRGFDPLLEVWLDTLVRAVNKHAGEEGDSP